MKETLEHVELTENIVLALKAQRVRTRIGPAKLMETIEDAPEGLNHGQINNWMYGDYKRVRKDYLKTVISAWESLPGDYVEISEDVVKRIEQEIKRTGVGIKMLFNRLADKPKDLNHLSIYSWGDGTKTARQPHIDYALKKWRDLPDKGVQKLPPLLRPGRIEITEEIKQAILDHQERTGIGVRLLFRGTRLERPEGLTSTTVYNWLGGKTATAQKSHVEYVLGKWGALQTNAMAELTSEILDKIRAEKKRTGIGAQRLLDMFEDIPDGLNSTIVDVWTSREDTDQRVKTARKDHIDYVLKRWAELPDK